MTGLVNLKNGKLTINPFAGQSDTFFCLLSFRAKTRRMSLISSKLEVMGVVWKNIFFFILHLINQYFYMIDRVCQRSKSCWPFKRIVYTCTLHKLYFLYFSLNISGKSILSFNDRSHSLSVTVDHFNMKVQVLPALQDNYMFLVCAIFYINIRYPSLNNRET